MDVFCLQHTRQRQYLSHSLLHPLLLPPQQQHQIRPWLRFSVTLTQDCVDSLRVRLMTLIGRGAREVPPHQAQVGK